MGSHKTSEIRRCSRFRELQPSPFAVFFTAVQPWTTQRIFFGGVSGSCRRSFLIHGLGVNARLKISLPLRCNLGNSPTNSASGAPPAAILAHKNLVPPHSPPRIGSPAHPAPTRLPPPHFP